MGLDRCGQCMRITMLVGNFVCLAGGLLVLIVGIWTCIDSGYLEVLLGTNLFLSSAYMMVVCGVVITLLTSVGCVGAIKEMKCMLLIYFIFLFFVFVVLLVGGILAYVFQGIVRDKMKNTMLSTIQVDYGNVNSVTETWDTLQTSLACCGVDVLDDEREAGSEPSPGYKVWMRNRKFRSTVGAQVPLSCCRRNDDGILIDESDCQGPNPSNSSTFHHGCFDGTVEMLRERALLLGGVSIGTACLMIVGMTLACTLFKLIDSSN